MHWWVYLRIWWLYTYCIILVAPRMKEGREGVSEEENKEARKEAGKKGVNLYSGTVYQHF